MCSSPSAPCECAPIDENKNPAAQADANKKKEFLLVLLWIWMQWKWANCISFAHELAMKLPGLDSQIFTAGTAQSRNTAVWFFRYGVRFAAFTVVKLWFWLFYRANFMWESLRENKYGTPECHSFRDTFWHVVTGLKKETQINTSSIKCEKTGFPSEN